MRDRKQNCLPALLRWSVVSLAIGLPSASLAVGDAVDRPHFKVDGVAIVWAADPNGTTPIASDFIVNNGVGETDLIADDVHTVITGSLNATDTSFPDGASAALRIQRIRGGPNQTTLQGDTFTTPADVLTPFQLRDSTDVRTIRSNILTSFYVATNKAFNIDVVASSVDDPDDLRLVRLRARVAQSGSDDGLGFGAAAQYPHSGNTDASGMRWNGYRRLSALQSGRNMFRGDRRTAISAGTIADQSVRFDLDYRWNTGNIDLSEGTFDVAADVVYTVYIP